MLWLLLVPLGALAEEWCYSQRGSEHYNLFASKTVYDLVRNPKPRVQNVPNCEPVTVWALLRHGTRYPHLMEIKKQKDLANLRDSILRNHNVQPRSGYQSEMYRVELGGELCWEDLELLRDWRYNVTTEDADQLTSSGVSETYLLGKRLRSDFPSVLDATYSEDRFKIRFTSKLRTKQSAAAFTRGMFDQALNLPEEFTDESLLEPNNNCSSWKMSTQSEGAKKQTTAFREGHLMRQLISSVSKRLGFRHDLTFDVISDMYDMCRFDKAWQQNEPNSPWCAAFTNDQLKLMEYDKDLSSYYESGYGNPFSSMLGCPLVSDLINTFHNRTMGNWSELEGPSGILYFTHSLTLRSVLIRLGIARDQNPPTADNYAQSERRQWRTSFISPFAGNLIAVLYKCGEVFKVMFYLNEHYVDYEGCDVGLCNWTYIHERFSPFVDPPAQCNLNFCKTSAASLPNAFSPLLLLLMLLPTFTLL